MNTQEIALTIIGALAIGGVAGTIAQTIYDTHQAIKQDERENYLAIKREDRRVKLNSLHVGDSFKRGLVLAVYDHTVEVIYEDGRIIKYMSLI